MSSALGGGDRAERAARLQKILEDYAALKKQNAILNKLLTEEQKHKAEIEESLSAKEVQMRSLIEENELISFNNRGLQKRCELLQEELREAQQRASSSGGWFGSGAKQELAQKKDELLLVQKELMTKISENEHIHMQMFDLKKQTQQSLQLMEQKLTNMKKRAVAAEEAGESAKSLHQEELTKLHDLKESLSLALGQSEADLIRTKRLLEERETHMKALLTDATQEVDRCRSLIARKICFDDSKVAFFNRYEHIPFSRSSALYYIETAGNLLVTTTQALSYGSSFFSKISARLQHSALLQDPAHPLAAVGQRIAAALSQLISLFQKLAELLNTFFREYQQAAAGGTAIAMVPGLRAQQTGLFDTFRQIISVYHEYATAEAERLRYEASHATDGPLESLLEQLRMITTQLTDRLQLVLKSCSDYAQFPCQSLMVFVQPLEDLRDHFRTTSETLLRQSDIETRRGLASILPPSHESQELANLLVKMVRTLQEYITQEELLQAQQTIHVHGATVPTYASLEPSVYQLLVGMENASARYLGALNDSISEHETISFEESVALQAQAQAMKEQIEQLSERTVAFQTRSSQLLQEKQLLQNELSSLKDSFNQKQARINSLLNEISVLRRSSLPAAQQPNLIDFESDAAKQSASDLHHHLEMPQATTAPTATKSDALIDMWSSSGTDLSQAVATNPTPGVASESPFDLNGAPPSSTATSGTSSKWSITVMDESGKQSHSLSLTPDQIERQRELERHYLAKIKHLQQRIHEMDEQVVAAQSRCQQSQQDVAAVEQSREDLRREIEVLTAKLTTAREDLEITRRNYDVQITMLTQHLISLQEEKAAHDKDPSPKPRGSQGTPK